MHSALVHRAGLSLPPPPPILPQNNAKAAMIRPLFLLSMLALSGTRALADPSTLAEFKAMFAADGVLDLRGQDDKGYSPGWVCPDFAVARTVVALLQPGEDPQAKDAAFARIRDKVGCTAATGQYLVTDAAPGLAMINWGYEAEDAWQALAAKDPAGQPVGLVFNASPYAP